MEVHVDVLGRPTWGAISREGIAQWAWTLDTLGFFSRSVDDIIALLETLAVVDDDPAPSTPFEVKGSKIGFAKTSNWSKAGSGTQNAMAKAKQILTSHGAEVSDVDLPSDQGFDKILKWHNIVTATEGRASFLGQYRTNKNLLHQDIAGHVENKENVSRADQLEAYDNCSRLRPIFDKIAASYDTIITPSIVDEAPKGLEYTGDMVSRRSKPSCCAASI